MWNLQVFNPSEHVSYNPTIIYFTSASKNLTQFVKVLLVKLSEMLHSSNFVTLFHRQSFALYGIAINHFNSSSSNTQCKHYINTYTTLHKHMYVYYTGMILDNKLGGGDQDFQKYTKRVYDRWVQLLTKCKFINWGLPQGSTRPFAFLEKFLYIHTYEVMGHINTQRQYFNWLLSMHNYMSANSVKDYHWGLTQGGKIISRGGNMSPFALPRKILACMM